MIIQSGARELAADWSARLAVFRHDCRASDASVEADRIREGHALFGALAEPARLRHDYPSAAVIEAMLDDGAVESAALALLGDRPFLLSRGGAGLCVATLVAPTSGKEVSADAGTPALALLAAIAAVHYAERRRVRRSGRLRFFTAAARVG